MIIAAYLTLNIYFYQEDDYHSIGITRHAFAAIRAAGYTTNVGMLSSMIYKLKNARVEATDTGHMKIKDATILLI